jgi:hypothetical protein
MTVLPEAPEFLANLRDLGGTPTSDGRRIRPGVLLRSDQPLTADSPPPGLPWPPPTVVDLRGLREEDGTHPLLGAGAVVEHLGLLAPGSTAIAALPRTLAELYAFMLDSSADRLGQVVEIVASRPAPVLLHCAAGKDRTGVAVALLLRLVGVGRAEVLADYTATAAAMPGVMARAARKAMGVRWQPGTMTGDVPAEFIEAPAAAMEMVLDRWDAHPGGVTGWARERAGVDDRTLVALTVRLVEDRVAG